MKTDNVETERMR